MRDFLIYIKNTCHSIRFYCIILTNLCNINVTRKKDGELFVSLPRVKHPFVVSLYIII